MIEIEASTFGPEVARLIGSGEGRVLAIVSNCLYLESLKGYVVAIVGGQAVNGPLSLRVHGLSRLLDVVGGQRDLTFRCRSQYVQIGTVAQISLRNAEQWVPRLPDRLGRRTARNEAAQRLAEAITGAAQPTPSGQASNVGLADLVRSWRLEDGDLSECGMWNPECEMDYLSGRRSPVVTIPHSEFSLKGTLYIPHWRKRWPFESRPGDHTARVLGRFADGILSFANALHSNDSNALTDTLVALVGLGEGLTPAGDDLVSGILATLVWHAHLEESQSFSIEHLRDRIEKAEPRTNRISARLLHYAAQGILYSPAMALGAALLEGDAEAVNEPARQLFAIGNTSGTDLATGILVGCLAVQGASV